MNTDSSILPAGASLQGGKYRIVKILGQGGFGITYLAEQTGLGMKVAIKEFFLKGSCQRSTATSEVTVPVTDNVELVSKCLKKFKSEARKIASLNHDHIVNIIDIFDENGTSYYVMKHLSGGSLADRIKDGAMQEADACRVVADIADALKAIHARGLLHLDIKPANILFDEHGRSVLIDFGVSKYVDSQNDTTTTSSLVGFSRGFAPLEQINATVASLTPATDLYALGATLYNLVVGSAPPEASLVMDSGLPPFPQRLSDAVKDTIRKSMQPRRKDRPQNVDAFMALLPQPESPVLEKDESTIIAVKEERPSERSSFMRKFSLIISAAMLVSAVLISGATFLKNRKASPAPVAIPAAETPRTEDLSGQVNSLTLANNDLTRQLNDLKNKDAALNSNNAGLRKQVDDLKKENTSLNAKVSILEKEISSLRNQVNSYKPDAERWRRQMEVNN